MVKGVYFNPSDTSYNIYKKKYEWEVSVKKGIDSFAKQKEEKYPYLYTEKEV